jgi:hypothetical protein
VEAGSVLGPAEVREPTPARTALAIMLIMTSWRDVATRQSQDDLDGLLNVTLPFAQEMLAKRGEMYPFGAAVTVDGGTRLLADDPGLGEHPAADAVRTSLLDALRRTRDELRAIAVCSDVRLPDSDAIRVELEHRDGQAIAVLVPYKKRFGQRVEYRDLRAGTAEKHVWP